MKALRTSPRPEGRRSGNVFIVVSMLLSLCILSLIKARYCSAPYVSSQITEITETVPTQSIKIATSEKIDELAVIEDEDEVKNTAEISQKQVAVTVIDPNKPLCGNTTKRSIICDAEGDVRIKASIRTVFLHPLLTNKQWINKPYARHHDAVAMKNIKEWTLKPFDDQTPKCTKTHSVPALVFSIGGFTGNLFHDFTDVIVPLFVSSYQFEGEVQFILADVKPWWVSKFGPILSQLSNYEIIDASNDGDEVRCFPRVIHGLNFHKELSVDPSKTPGNYSTVQFKEVLRKAFGLERATAEPTGTEWDIRRKPRLLIITRKKTRVFLNERGLTDMALSLGFDVRVAEPEVTSDLGKFARLVNSADVMIGVHGAGLTNMVFLPDNAVLIQVVPMGGLEWLARDTFKQPAPDMQLKYLDYKIQADESTLSEQYPKGHPVLTDPYSIHKKGWYEISRVYLENQNVRPHLGRLRNTLLEALRLMPQYNQKNSAYVPHSVAAAMH